MSNQVRADKQLAIAAIGAGSAALTGVVLGLIETATGFAIYSLTLNLIPVGAFFAGFAAASGYYFGAKLFHQKPAGGVVLNMVLASISAYLLVHYVPYYSMEVDGTRVKEAISFWSYLDFSIRHTSISSTRSTSAEELGSILGYIYALVQLIGFSFGGLAVFGWLLRVPFCGKCETYLKKTNTQNRYTSDEQVLSEQIKIFTTKLDRRKELEALVFYADRMGVAKSSGHHLRTRITLRKCTTCGIYHLDFKVYRLVENDWQDIAEARIRRWVVLE